MQNIKDSFYVTLRDRLTVVNPARTVTVSGVVRSAIVVQENELAADAKPTLEVFYFDWKMGNVVVASGTASHPLLEIECVITYGTEGSESQAFQDRGRTLTAMDNELLAIAFPARGVVKDYTQIPASDLKTQIFWTRPDFKAVEMDGRKLTRTAVVKVYGHVEANI